MTGLIQTIDPLYEPLGDELIDDLSEAVGLTVPAGAVFAWIQAQDKDVRLRDSGSDPTAANGLLITASGLTIWYQGDLTKVKLIEVEASAAVFVSYYGPSRLAS